MGRKKLELVGERYGRLVVAMRAGPSKEGFAQWLCQCDCGNTKVIRQISLRAGLTKSCGCYAKDMNTVHGDSGTPLHNEWRRLRDRTKPVDPRWLEDYATFKEEVGAMPFDGAKLRAARPGALSRENMVWSA